MCPCAQRGASVVRISGLSGSERVWTLTATPLVVMPALIRAFDPFLLNTPSDELLRQPLEKGLRKTVDYVDILGPLGARGGRSSAKGGKAAWHNWANSTWVRLPSGFRMTFAVFVKMRVAAKARAREEGTGSPPITPPVFSHRAQCPKLFWVRRPIYSAKGNNQ